MLDDSTVGSCGFEIEVKFVFYGSHPKVKDWVQQKRATRLISVALFC
jgi:hypothetical protein